MSDVKRMGLAVFALALAVRLLLLILLPPTMPETADETEYLALGQNLRQHGTLSFGAPHRWGESGTLNGPGPFAPTAARPPLYPLLIAALWWGEKPPVLAICIAQALLGAAVAWLVYSTALHAFGTSVANVAGIGMALAPTSAFLARPIMTEALFTFLLMSSVWFWSRRRGLAAGLLLGSATLVRPVSLFLVPLIACAGLVTKFNRKLHLYIALGAVLVIAPWTIRNAVTQGSFIPVATYGWGSVLDVGTRFVPYGSGNPFETWAKDAELQAMLKQSQTIEEAERRFRESAWSRIKSDPLHWLWNRVKDYPRLFLDYGTHFMHLIPLPAPIVQVVFAAMSLVFFLLSASGMYLARRSWRQTYYAAFIPIVLLGMQFPGAGASRYSITVVPMLMIFAALAVCRLKDRYASAAGKRAPVARA